MSKFLSDLKKVLTPGTPLCALIYAAVGVVLAILLLSIGFWKTLIIIAFGAIGGLIGGIGNKQQAVREAVNRRFPDRDVPIRDPGAARGEASADIDQIIADVQKKDEQIED